MTATARPTAGIGGRQHRTTPARSSANLGCARPEKRKLRPRRLTSRARIRTAAEYSNVIDRERLRETSSGLLTCPNDRERPLRREFASRGAVTPTAETDEPGPCWTAAGA